uniref:Uncharacterized protein n=1 Tax=viral metagenome TaxID=1070528 RepID=A0A6M3JGH3_9ZZZZ
MKTKKYQNKFFERLRDKLDEIFPKTNYDNPEIPSKGNRSGALALNAFANIIFKDILDEVLIQKNKKIENLIAEEMLICHKEGTPTSRLTSLANKIKKLGI